MKERPILFATSMVRGILSGAKVQTRRLAKFEPIEPGFNLGFSGVSAGHYCTGAPESGHVLYSRRGDGVWEQRTEPLHCPFGRVGDRLWVKETWMGWRLVSTESDEWEALTSEVRGCSHRKHFAEYGRPDSIEYRATSDSRGPWNPAIFMLREYSRITLEINDVRVERLNAISEEDARAEGVRPFFETFSCFARDQRITTGELAADAEHRASFAVLWDELNGDRASWKSNPWTWVLTFRPVTP